MGHILVIGGASFDILHLKDQTVYSPGGVGMYTAMAARRCGAQVSMVAPLPDPCPPELQPVANLLTDWLGPAVPPEQLPRFEISYRSGKTEYLNMFLGAAEQYSIEMLPQNLAPYDLVHVAQKYDIQVQIDMIEFCRRRGAKLISAGTYPVEAQQRPQTLRKVLDSVDYFFMNKREATAVFGSLDSAATSAGKVLFVTCGKEGARIIQGETSTAIPAVTTSELDPTGAGDTFCGATLAYLLQNEHPIMAAHHAAALSAEMITQVGPTALLSGDPPPAAALDPRVQINEGQLQKAAAIIATLSDVSPFPFVSPELPPPGHPRTLDYFFAATLQQFSFWTSKENHYDQPLIATRGGVELKGSDYLWRAYSLGLEQDRNFCAPQRQASLSRADLAELFRADNGTDPMPALDLHLQQAQIYGQDMLALNLTPYDLLQNALASPQPLITFLVSLDQIGGYKEDPLRKKSALLAMILNQRPEQFFPLRADEQIPPVIDYHALRSCLRIGLIDVIDHDLLDKISSRRIVSAAEEWAVRSAAYRATEQLIARSGRSTGTVDWFLFSARQRCPEMSEPECAICAVDPICAHRKELFQPVLRTTFY